MPSSTSAIPWLLNGSSKSRSKFRVGRNLLADLLEDLADLFDIGVESDAKRQFLDHPVAAEILDLADLAIGNRRQGTALMAQGNRPNRDFLDGPLGAGRLDIFAEAEGIVDQEEQAGHHIFHQRLRAEADGEPKDAQAGDQRPDIDADDTRIESSASARMLDLPTALSSGTSVPSRERGAPSASSSPATAGTSARKARPVTVPTTFHRNAATNMISATPDAPSWRPLADLHRIRPQAVSPIGFPAWQPW